MQDLLKNLYGDDVVNTALKIIFEFLFYIIAGGIGALIREFNLEKRHNTRRLLGSSFLVATILFVGANYLKARIQDNRLIFGLAVLLGIYLPNFKTPFKNGKLFRAILGVFSSKAQKFLDDTDILEDSPEKDSSNKE